MENNFERALAFTFQEEGVHSNDKDDPGGETKYGIARKYHPEISEADWADFTRDKAADIYRSQYWDACHCDMLATPLDIAVFDTAVNCGPGAAVKMRQECTGFTDYLFLRIHYYLERVREKPVKVKYLAGWIGRVVRLYRKFK